jgi:hypothetical protein
MLKSGRDGDDAARAESAYQSAAIAAAIAPGPEVLIVGHGPERPNTYHRDGFFRDTTSPYLFPTYVPPYGRSSYEKRSHAFSRVIEPQPRALCYATVNTSGSRTNSMTYVTECPPVLQPYRKLPR